MITKIPPCVTSKGSSPSRGFSGWPCLSRFLEMYKLLLGPSWIVSASGSVTHYREHQASLFETEQNMNGCDNNHSYFCSASIV